MPRHARPIMTDESRSIFAADMAANLLAAFLLILALMPYAERAEPEAPPTVAMTVTSGRAFVDALHRRAVEGAGPGSSFEIRHERDIAAACGPTSGAAPVLLVLKAELLPAIARGGCRTRAAAQILIVPSALKAADGDWSPAMRRLLAAPEDPDAFRRRLLALLQGGPGASGEAGVPPRALAHLLSIGEALRRWGDFITAAVMLILLVRVRTARERGST